MTKRWAILQAFVTRLAAIQIVNGFATDAGQAIFLGTTPELGPDDPAAVIAVLPELDAFVRQGEKVSIVWPITIVILVPAAAVAPWQAAENGLGDVKTAVELADRTLGGLVPNQFTRGATRPFTRLVGTTPEGLAITYAVPYWEGWGLP